MESFLYSVAQRLINTHPNSFDGVTVVFNNRRAGLFLSSAINELLKKGHTGIEGIPTHIMPRIIGIDELIAELGGLQVVPNEFLLFELYDIHRGLNSNEVGRRFDTFEEFIPFGEMLLSDFSEIDLYQVEATQILQNLREIKQMGEWDVSGSALTPFQEKYITFYNSLIIYYNELHARLLSKQQAYSGMAYRNVAEHIDFMIDKQYPKHLMETYKESNVPHIWFVGFNALSNCELSIMNSYVRQGLGTVVFDGDDYYLSDTQQEAGHFLRKLVNQFPGNKEFANHFSSEEKHITITNCPENLLQAKVAGRILGTLFPDAAGDPGDTADNKILTTCKNDKIEDPIPTTALVLADESMLIPVLNSLPANVSNVNITMGYPFIHSSIHLLASNILQLHIRSKGHRYHHTELNAVLCDNLIARILQWKNIQSTITQRLSSDKMVYASSDYLLALLATLPNGDKLNYLFPNDKGGEPTADDALEMLQQTVVLIAQSNVLGDNVKENESLASFTQLLNYLHDLQQTYHCMDTLTTLQRIYSRLAQRRSVPFYGEPLKGLQILGMLETRSLDFDRVIMMSVNEGTLPTGRSDNSLIPLFLKRKFNIPTFEEKDAVYANHFYRLLQKSKEIHLLYSSDPESSGKGQPSRFILQVCNELAERYSNIHIHQQVVYADNGTPVQSPCSKAIIDEKTRQRLQQMAQRGFSPTGLNNYRSCPLKFFYQNIIGINRDEELKDDLESDELGSCIHQILQNIYSIDGNHLVTAAHLRNALADLSNTVDDYFKDELLKGRTENGKNHIYNEVAKLQIRRFLEQEIKHIGKRQSHRN